MMEIIRTEGDPAVAEVGLIRFRGDERFTVEVVDGLAPPLPREEKWIVNVSTQFGCPVRCPFCDAAASYAGNPGADEILSQVRWVLDRHPRLVPLCRKLKVHFARMGEPSLNDAVLLAMERLPDLVRSDGLWCCVASIAPRGREAWFDRLLEIKQRHYRGRFQLQFSVQSTEEKERERLVPVKHWTLTEIAGYGQRFFVPGDRKVVLNFALAQGVHFDPEAIAGSFDPACFAVKLTPVNPTAAGQRNGFATILRSRAAAQLDTACAALRRIGFDVVLSVGDGREDRVGSNCGQAVRVLRKLT